MEQAMFLAEKLRKAGSSVLPAVCPRPSTPCPILQKLTNLLWFSKQLCHELKLYPAHSDDAFWPSEPWQGLHLRGCIPSTTLALSA